MLGDDLNFLMESAALEWFSLGFQSDATIAGNDLCGSVFLNEYRGIHWWRL